MASISPFPHHYDVALAEGVLTSGSRAPIAAGPPPQFGGSDRVWSPEELLVASVLECLWTTFDAYARHEGLPVGGWAGRGSGVLEKGKPVPMFSTIALEIELTVAAVDEERARRLLATAEQRCIITNALKAPVTVAITVRHG